MIAGRASGSLDWHMNQLGLLLITPDFNVHGPFDALIDWIHSLDAVICAAIPTFLNDYQIAYLYNGRASHEAAYPTNREVWHPNRSSLMRGRCICLLLRRSDATRPLQSDIVRTKGRSAACASDDAACFRRRSPRSDRYFSLVHTPDDAAGVLEEAAIILRDRFLYSSNPLEYDCVPPYMVKAILSYHDDWITTDPVEPALQALRVGLARLAADPRVEISRNLAIELFEEMSQRRRFPENLENALQSCLSPATRRADPDDALLGSVMAQSDALALRAALMMLARPDQITPLDCGLIIDAFERAAVSLEKWIAHRLYLYAMFHAKNSEYLEFGREASPQ